MNTAQALDIARHSRVAVLPRAELVLALDVLARELDRREARTLEDARLRAHAMRVS